MRAWLKYGLITLASLVAVLAVFVLWIYASGGGFKTIEHQFAGTCEPVTGPGSTEDIAIDRDTGLALLSTRIRPAPLEGAHGFIVLYNIASGAQSFQEALMPGPDDFTPHGISLFKDQNGNKRLFVINHRADDEESIEIYDMAADGRFTHVETIRDPLLTSPNNLVAVGPRQFYVANDAGASGGLSQMLDMSFGIGFLNLIYYDGQEMRVVDDGVSFGGGIAASADGSQIYVAFTTAHTIDVYDRDATSGDLNYRTSVDLDMSPDNIDVAEDGSLWVAGHPSSIALGKHFASRGQSASPSQVSRIPMADGDPGTPEDIYLDPGDELTASSVAATYNGKMLVGSITARKFLLCDLPEA